jgi:radical SAM protein with 4Fe4S-binding SPASM domain
MIREAIDRAFKPSLAEPAPGLHAFRREANGGHARIHLRMEADGRGTMIVDAARVLHLNATAALMAYWILSGMSADQAARTLARKYHVSFAAARTDFDAMVGQINAITSPGGPCPVCDLGLDVDAPFSNRPSSPYRMDLAITYRCQNDCSHCYNARPRSYPEKPAAYWQRALDRIRDLGIPHVVFTGGEPTLRNDLPALVAHAQKRGLIVGLNTNGRRLADRTLARGLADAGLDHVQITLESHDEAIHDAITGAPGAWRQTVNGIRNIIETNLYVMTNTTLLQSNHQSLDETLGFLAALGVPTVGLNALIYSGRGANVGTGLAEEDLAPLLELARNRTTAAKQRLIWYTPTEYCRLDPVQMNLGVKGCTAALYNMCMEPDGAVIPCQSFYQPLGNLLSDPWDTIWNHPLAEALRERRMAPTRCTACKLLSECGGGCPLSPRAEAIVGREQVLADAIPVS